MGLSKGEIVGTLFLFGLLAKLEDAPKDFNVLQGGKSDFISNVHTK